MAGPEAQMSLHGDRNSGRIIPSLLDYRRNIRPPIQPVVPKGSILIRDLRLWHCGRPNLTDEIRVMLAQIRMCFSFGFGCGVFMIMVGCGGCCRLCSVVSESE